MLHIQLNGIMKCSNMVAHILPPGPRGIGSIGQKSSFSEFGLVAYQIKGNYELSNMIANILHAYPLSRLT